MSPEDMFFTHTIVGSALSLPLGDAPAKADTPNTPSPGLLINLQHGGTALNRVWKDWILIQGAYPYPGRPRPRPAAVRRWLEKYALLIAVAGILAMLGAAVLVLSRLT